MTTNKRNIHMCPRCESNRFIATARVTQDWAFDEKGDYIETTDNCVEILRHPNDEDIWTCETCGNSMAGEDFIVELYEDILVKQNLEKVAKKLIDIAANPEGYFSYKLAYAYKEYNYVSVSSKPQGVGNKTWLSLYVEDNINKHAYVVDTIDMTIEAIVTVLEDAFNAALLELTSKAQRITEDKKWGADPRRAMFNRLLEEFPHVSESNNSGCAQNGSEILSKSKYLIDILVATLENVDNSSSVVVVTGYYDPEEDIRDNCVDNNTGYYYLTITITISDIL